MTVHAIEAEALGKQYKLGVHLRYSALRDSIAHALSAPVRGAIALATNRERPARPESHRIWALRDVSFEIEDGDVVGVIGPNGAGKSTLLKVLSRITEPTEGRAEIRGNVSSLLEVGTGFHPELTGRENVFLNGAILGMSRADIVRKFDEIIEFAGVERFVDTPVKRFSSGMQLRLAFAVAANLEPDVLFVDEVLAVGDAAFQRRCLGRIGEIAHEGRTVLFVSHQMAAIRDLCPKTMWLDGGRLMEFGPTSEVVDHYLLATSDAAVSNELVFEDDLGYAFHVQRVRLTDVGGTSRRTFEISDPPVIELSCVARKRIPGLYGYVVLSRADGTKILEADSWDLSPNPLDGLEPGEHRIRIGLPARTFAPGDYSLYVSFASPLAESDALIHSPRDIGTFTLDDFTTRRANRRRGYLTVPLSWDVSSI